MEIGDPPAKHKSAVWKSFGFPKYKSAVWKFFGFPKYKEGGITVVKET